MDYTYTKCPHCGSNDIKVISSSVISDNLVHKYQCNSCDDFFSSEKLYRKDLSRSKSYAIDGLKEKIRYQSNRIEKLEKNRISNDDGNLIFERDKRFVIEIVAETDASYSYGTGIIYKDDYVFTNAHVIMCEGKKASSVVYGRFLKQTFRFCLQVVYVDPIVDFAVLRFMHEVSIAGDVAINEFVKTGERCYTLGNAKGLGIAIFEGIIADNDRVVRNEHYLMFTAAVTNGNSGGPLFNSHGELIGMVTSGRKDSSAMNYALPISPLVALFKKVIRL